MNSRKKASEAQEKNFCALKSVTAYAAEINLQSYHGICPYSAKVGMPSCVCASLSFLACSVTLRGTKISMHVYPEIHGMVLYI